SPSMGLGFGLLATLRSLALVPGPYIAGYLYALRPDLPFLASIASIPAVILLTTIVLRRSL
ncbi:MAG: MFS transporter, partial [Anaerolineae bacterium]